MADWSQVGQGIQRGYAMGRESGGKLAGVGNAIALVADRLRKQRETGEEIAQKQNLLGYEGLMKGTIQPAQTDEQGTTFEVPGMPGSFKAKQMPVYRTDASGNLIPVGEVEKGAKVISQGQGGVDKGQASAIAGAIMSGDQPPDLRGLYRFGGPVKAALAEKGFDLTKATRDWTAVNKTIAGLNSTQQIRMRQALDSVEMGIPALQELSDNLQRTGLRDINWITVNAALRGVDSNQRDTATKYITQINVMKDELAQGFMGGGVPTDRAFKLAEDVLQPMYGKEQFTASLNQLGYNLKIRKTAIENISPLSTSGEVNNPKMTGKTSPSTIPTMGQSNIAPIQNQSSSEYRVTPRGNKFRIIQ